MIVLPNYLIVVVLFVLKHDIISFDSEECLTRGVEHASSALDRGAKNGPEVNLSPRRAENLNFNLTNYNQFFLQIFWGPRRTKYPRFLFHRPETSNLEKQCHLALGCGRSSSS